MCHKSITSLSNWGQFQIAAGFPQTSDFSQWGTDQNIFISNFPFYSVSPSLTLKLKNIESTTCAETNCTSLVKLHLVLISHWTHQQSLVLDHHQWSGAEKCPWGSLMTLSHLLSANADDTWKKQPFVVHLHTCQLAWWRACLMPLGKQKLMHVRDWQIHQWSRIYNISNSSQHAPSRKNESIISYLWQPAKLTIKILAPK